MAQRFMTIDEVSDLTRIPVNTLRWWRHINDGRGPKSFRLGGRVLYTVDEVEAWIDSSMGAAVA
ncbi:helix-turn-helix transcriptional regulator [Demequina capsici]|uniref:Helix-turn-helix domain-containing protein n=1 Tax=Demequina capsici TaxID=3075620 RepID=A0AA96J952_9MICO|nr:helix-turn-helix domain-containing protein [Demequina sp. OYTSA14]WNM25648.1 helix-turn-helix domain-containing protein [Demequina sp. OYTSA14]